jgi:hypothetical protein
MTYNYTITCTSATDILYFSYSDISGNVVEFNLSSGQSFSYSGSFQPYLVTPFPKNVYSYSISIS